MSIVYLKPQALQTAEPFSGLFPVKLSTLRAITESIEANGFDPAEPIVTWGGLVIDGHTRLGAALAAGVEEVPIVEKVFADEDEALQYAIKRQRDRRNLTDSDLLHCLEVLDNRKDRAANLPQPAKASGEALGIQGTYDAPKGKSAEATAEILGTSRAKVERARAVLDHAPEAVKAQVQAGEKSINAAYNETRPAPTPRPRPARNPHPAVEGDAGKLEGRVIELEAQVEERDAAILELTKLLRDTEEENKSFGRVIDSDDQLKAAMDEAKRFRELARVTQERNNGMMGQNHALAADCKRWMNKFLRLEKATKGTIPVEEEDSPFDAPDLEPLSA